MQTLKIKLNSLAMPVTNVTPNDPKIKLAADNQHLKFTVQNTDLTPQQINCFQNGQALTMSLQGNTISVDIQPITQPGRHRVNCTAPSHRKTGRYYWFSHPLFMPTPEGQWLD